MILSKKFKHYCDMFNPSQCCPLAHYGENVLESPEYPCACPASWMQMFEISFEKQMQESAFREGAEL